MRILIVHNALNDSTSVSGVLKHYAWMANAWIALGHSVDFLVAKVAFAQLKELAPQAGRISSDSLFNADKYIQKTWRYFPAYALRLISCHWQRMPVHYDVVYASAQLFYEVYPTFVLARRLRAKFVVKIQHMLAAQTGRTSLFDRLFLWTERASIRLMNRHADLILCMTPIVAEDYHRLEASLGLPRHETTQVACGIDYHAIQLPASVEKRFDVVFLGRMHKQKGVFDLPKMWQRVLERRPDARLLVIGEGPHRLATQQMFNEMGLAASVVFTGGISEKEKHDLLFQSKIGLSLSYEEGWGISVTELLATGLPVVGYKLPVFSLAFPNLLELVPLGDYNALADSLVNLLADPEKCQRMGGIGRQFVSRYDYHHIAKAEMAALAVLLGKA